MPYNVNSIVSADITIVSNSFTSSGNLKPTAGSAPRDPTPYWSEQGCRDLGDSKLCNSDCRSKNESLLAAAKCMCKPPVASA